MKPGRNGQRAEMVAEEDDLTIDPDTAEAEAAVAEGEAAVVVVVEEGSEWE